MSRRLSVVILILTAVSALAVPLVAHHSFAATYVEDKQQTIEGDLVTFVFRNPHSFVHVEVADPGGEKIRYAVEWASGSSLNGQGITRETLKAGDHVIVVGQPGRNDEDHRMRMKSINRPSDGWKWSGTFQ
ncbi:MAG TPA: DUF6152 family protein [Vicinamibacterales bacterium]|jgi:hypothetical protein|nr:DUF6152 family protein [Vicinamibacterales bacterium]